MTLKDLLARAKFLGIKGRHDMSKAQLEAEVANIEAVNSTTVDVGPDFTVNAVDPEEVDINTRAKALGLSPSDFSFKDLKVAVAQRESVAQVSDAAKQAASELKGSGRARRSNLNAPWARKFYFVDKEAYDRLSDEVKKAPMQVQLILKFMVNEGITTSDDAMQGIAIVTDMIAKRAISTKIEPQVLFAYYRSKMEHLGLVFAGYDLGGETEAEADVEPAVEDDAADNETSEEGDAE